MPSNLKRRSSESSSSNMENASDFSQPSTPKQIKTEHDSQELSKEERQERVFSNMRLRRIVKENHGSDINQLAFFFNNKNFSAPYGIDQSKTFDKRGAVQRDQSDTSNVLVTVGGAQINVYDNEHCGDHLDIMSHFNLAIESEEGSPPNKLLHSACWLHRPEDALIAVGGADMKIHILSLANSQELAILSGHSKTITDIQAYPQDDTHILSTSKDGTVRLWDVTTEKCLAIYDADATVSIFHPSGETFITAGPKGDFREWQVPNWGELSGEPQQFDKKSSRLLKKMHNDSQIDCIRYVNGNLLSKSINGRMEYWDPATETSIRSFRVKTGENFSRFDVSLNESFFCVGSSSGAIYVFNLHTGKQIAELQHRRSTKAVRCCVFTRDCRSVICAGEDAFIWRYDYIDDETLKEWANLQQKSSD
ncbi:hypothetical protein INT43_002761 [Umbelopsis isabellina]|uniref:WD40 repeat-like protein n=1 Tax=Mortierella isabellina TaxID=91625 RepID=A0A8H7UNJ7_MORIS|nr:hypothetical protein INT43_002761 [Umbelopsis isabellina]